MALDVVSEDVDNGSDVAIFLTAGRFVVTETRYNQIRYRLVRANANLYYIIIYCTKAVCGLFELQTIEIILELEINIENRE